MAWGEKETGRELEHIILYGEERTGKTYGMLSLIHAAAHIDPTLKCFVISTDGSMRRDLQNFEWLNSNDYVEFQNVHSFEDVLKATDSLSLEIMKRRKEGFTNDWVCVDRASRVWDWIPAYYCQKILQKPLDQVEKDYQQSKGPGEIKKGSAILEFYTNGINPMWNRWESRIREQMGCNVIMVAATKEISESGIPGVRGPEDPNIVKAYRGIGYKPAFQNKTPYLYETILYLSQPYTKVFCVTTAGEKGKRKWLGPKEPLFNKDVQKSLGVVYMRDVVGVEGVDWDLAEAMMG